MSQPIRFRDTAAPIDTPTPAFPPTPRATDAPTTRALTDELLSAMIFTSPALSSVLLLMAAFTRVRIVFVDSAPAPLRAMPACPPSPAASDAATDSAMIDASFTQRDLSA